MEREKLSISLKLNLSAAEEKENNVPLKKIKLNISQTVREFSMQEFLQKLEKEFPNITTAEKFTNLVKVKEYFKKAGKEGEIQEFIQKFVPKASEDKVKALFHGISTRDVKSVEKILKR